MTKLNDFSKEIFSLIGSLIKLIIFDYWYLVAMFALIVSSIAFLGKFKLFRSLSYKFNQKSIIGKAVIIIIIIFIIAVFLS